MIATKARFYQPGGTLRPGAPSYVERRADSELHTCLQQGEFCYVLTSRQMGKSSLMARTAARLREEGIAVAILDLTFVGQNLTAEQWYGSLLSLVGRQLDLEDELEGYWLAHERESPLQRWRGALQEVVLARCPGPVVLFVDEIDAVRSLPFSSDEFFAAIRACYNRRSEEPEFHRLTFCLLGVATPSDLIQDVRTTPFNIGRRIELTDFTEAEAAPLAQGLGRTEVPATSLLRRVLYWTGGHPYLTQRLCQVVAEDASVNGAAGVDRLCERLFLSRAAQERDDNLLFVRKHLVQRVEAQVASLLDLYGRVRRGKRVPEDETSQYVSVLGLSGITRAEGGRLKVRNRIYEQVFDRVWVATHVPDAELRRQRAAYRKGMLSSMAIVDAALLVACTLFVVSDLITFRRAMVQDYRSFAAVVASYVDAAIEFRDRSQAESFLRSLRVKPDIVYSCIYNADGSVFATYPPGYRPDTGRQPVRRLVQGSTAVPPSTGPPVDGYRYEHGRLVIYQPVFPMETWATSGTAHAPWETMETRATSGTRRERVGTLCLISNMHTLHSRWKLYAGVVPVMLLGPSVVAFLLLLRQRRGASS